MFSIIQVWISLTKFYQLQYIVVCKKVSMQMGKSIVCILYLWNLTGLFLLK